MQISEASYIRPPDRHQQPFGQSGSLAVQDWGVTDYDTSLSRQLKMVQSRIAGKAADRLVLVEHPPVVPLGKSGTDNDLRIPETLLRQQGVNVCRVERGGMATFHGPGQLVVYPIIKLKGKDLQAYVDKLLTAAEDVLHACGLNPARRPGQPGIWVNGAKIASVGIAVRKWVTFHGLSLNVDMDLSFFKVIHPCGKPGEKITSMARETGKNFPMDDVRRLFVEAFANRFGYHFTTDDCSVIDLPAWLLRPAVKRGSMLKVEQTLACHKLNTVCNSARCPNLGECFSRGTATFMILGTVCTRGCCFCAVDKGMPAPEDPGESLHLAEAVKSLALTYVVVTSVTRDDLPDGGAAHFAETIRCIRKDNPATKVEVLVPDFKGDTNALDTVCRAQPDMFNHNLETVRRIYPAIGRPPGNYRRSLAVLRHAAESALPVKSGLMLGLGETDTEIHRTLIDLVEAGCRYLTLGQYLAPSENHQPVARYVSPEEFETWRKAALNLGFSEAVAGPLVRSSYQAEMMATE